MYTLIRTLLLVSLVSTVLSSSSKISRPSGPTSQDLSLAETRELLGQKIVGMRIVERPLKGLEALYPLLGGNSLGPYAAKHSGVEVVTQDGKHWLIHKGDNFGREKGGNTVITPLSSMSSKWRPSTDWRDSNIRVTDALRLGGKSYSLLLDNCNMASSRIYDSPSSKIGQPGGNGKGDGRKSGLPVQNWRPSVYKWRRPVKQLRRPVKQWRRPVKQWRRPVKQWRRPANRG